MMMEWLDPIFLARIQFAFTISFHIIFPAFTIGLASYLAVLEGLWLRSDDPHFKELYQFWIKIFAVVFGMGVVSGVVMSYQFGTNWSVFSDRVSNVIGPLLGFEVLTAFFLESSFLGIMLFGWGRVSRRMHFASTCIVAVGTLISAFWILSVNSWMQTPQGFEIGADGRLNPTNWMQIIWNPSFSHRLVHMTVAAYLTTACVVGGVAAFYLKKKIHQPAARTMLVMSTLMMTIVAPIQLFVGHSHGHNTMEHQPAKVAAIEGNWEHSAHAPLYLFGIPNEKTERIDYAVSIPGGASWILTGSTDGVIPHLKAFPKQDRPPVGPVFWSFRVMVGIGFLMIAIGFISTFCFVRKKLFTARWLHNGWLLMSPLGFVALLSGWFVTEIGRQPYTVYKVIRVGESVSPAILGPQIAWSLLAFVVMYALVFGAGIFYVFKLIKKGPGPDKPKELFYDHSVEALITHVSPSEKV